MTVNIANDTTLFIDRSIESVYKTIAEAVMLVALVIFLFLGTVRASVIPLVTIPVCLIGACTLMLVAGFSLNTLTLLSLVLAIGLVVDDSIVVLENIYRHVEDGHRADGGRVQGHARGRLRGHRDDADAGGGVRARSPSPPGAPAGCSSSSRSRWPARCWCRASSR